MKHKHRDAIIAWADGAIIQYQRCGTEWKSIPNPSWDKNVEYRASLAIVEGKPVFKDDVLYNTRGAAMPAQDWWTQKWIDVHKLSWSPPKPKTITVTIPMPKDVIWGSDYVKIWLDGSEAYTVIRKAMEQEQP